MAATLLHRVELLGVSDPGCARVDVRPDFAFDPKAICAIQGMEPTCGPLTADADAVRPSTGSAMGNYWVHTPKFGHTDHFQRWRFAT
ncbi:MAG: hypothetical protein AAFN30_11510 [Actinomycetota bacterium]